MDLFDQALADYDLSLSLGKNDRWLWRNRIEIHAARKDWNALGGDASRALEAWPQEVFFAYAAGISRLALGDTAGYRAICRKMVGSGGGSRGNFSAFERFRLSSLGSQEQRDVEPLLPVLPWVEHILPPSEFWALSHLNTNAR